METATLTSPARPLMVPPIQKSLSLPSYARAGGEGIDHKIIFAALEQREKVRRKSKIFKDKEKCGATRQNYFCLPLPSNAKCRETSLSSDTSCSSLEFQKPKCRSSPTKLRNLENERKSLQNGVHDSEKMTPSPTLIKTDIALNEIDEKGESKKESLSPVRMDVSRSTIGSSDSMERIEKSSKSSNDSLSRRERLVAIKARVEAEREKKLCGSSSSDDDDDVDLRITRHNSDGVIHRTVREVKSKSSKYEKRLRRKTQDEMAMRRTLRKLHTSLYLPSTSDFDVWKPPILRTGSSYSLQRDLDEFSKEFLSTDHKTDCNPAFYSNSVSNHNYFSDICSGSFRSRLNKAKFEETESTLLNKQQINPLRREKMKHDISFPDTNNNFAEYQDNQKKFSFRPRDMQYDGSHFRRHGVEEPLRKCPSPICRAPTPPPRSPKSIEFVNKAFIQHQNATNIFQESRSLERKKTFCRPNLTHCANSDDIQYQKSCNSPKTPESPDIVFFDRRNKDMISSRRRTLCNFPQVDDMETNQRPRTPTNVYRNKFLAQNFPPRSPDLSHKLSDSSRKTKGYASGPDVSVSKMVLQHELPAKKWEKMELDSEKKFNSLENKSKTNMSAWLKDRWLMGQRNSCSCDDPHNCVCGHGVRRFFKIDKKYSDVFQINPVHDIKTKINTSAEISNKTSRSMPTSKTPPIPSDRLSKSEANLAKRSPPKTPSPKLKNKPSYSPENTSKNEDEMLFYSGQNASQNLDTAMEELENVYRSLRVSNENLSITTGDQTENLNSYREFALRQKTKSNSSFRNRTTSGSVRNSLNERLIKEKAQVDVNTSNPNLSFSKATVNDNEKNSLVREALGIEELFSDLTQQLDLEQQLLQETKNRKGANKPQGQQSDYSSSTQETSKPLETQSTIPSSPKPIYEANHKKPSLGDEFGTSEAHFDVKERLTALRKREIVGSLSSNIAYLMKGNENKKETAEHFALNRNQSSPRCCAEGEEKSSGKHVAKETTSLCQKSEDTDKIWQVRVSMSSGNTRADTSMPSPQNDRLPSGYSRLRSALKLPRTDNSRDSSPCPSSFYFRENGNDSNELEKMLSNLLSEVPQTKGLPSQTESKLAETQHEETKKTVKGEMLVMQHLDVIRNFDPS